MRIKKGMSHIQISFSECVTAINCWKIKLFLLKIIASDSSSASTQMCRICNTHTHSHAFHFENYYCVSKLQVWLASFFLPKSFTGEWNKWKCVALCVLYPTSVHGQIWATMMTIRCNMLKYARKLGRHVQTHTNTYQHGKEATLLAMVGIFPKEKTASQSMSHIQL